MLRGRAGNQSRFTEYFDLKMEIIEVNVFVTISDQVNFGINKPLEALFILTITSH